MSAELAQLDVLVGRQSGIELFVVRGYQKAKELSKHHICERVLQRQKSKKRLRWVNIE